MTNRYWEGEPMKVAVINGSPRKGNTYRATQIFKDALAKQGAVEFTEFFFSQALPEFCLGCQLCLGNPCEKCPHSAYVAPILNALLEADAIIVTSPHFSGSSVPGSLKNLFDHLDFLTLTVAPRDEMFVKKAFIITTGSGSTSAAKIIRTCLKGWGINRVYSIGLRLLTDRWDKMPKAKQAKFDNALLRAARKFYIAPQRYPYLSTIFMYHLNKFILKKYVGEGNYPYEYWREHGYFEKRPF